MFIPEEKRIYTNVYFSFNNLFIDFKNSDKTSEGYMNLETRIRNCKSDNEEETKGNYIVLNTTDCNGNEHEFIPCSEEVAKCLFDQYEYAGNCKRKM